MKSASKRASKAAGKSETVAKKPRQFHSWSDIKASAPLSPEAERRTKAWVAQRVVELNLQALRKQLGITQAEVAAATGYAQGEVSRIEQRDDHMVSTLRRVVQALGGELEVHARFPDGRDIRLVGV